MPASLMTRVAGKWHAARTLAQFRRSFANWREVWQAYRTSSPLPPMVLPGGMTLHHDPADDPILLFREIFIDRTYTRGGFYRPESGDLVVDIGGNIGFFALSLQREARGVRVQAFEPAAATRARFQQNIQANQFNDLIQVHPFAVTGSPGEVLLQQASLTGHRSLFDRQSGRSDPGETVASIGLDQAVAMAGGGSVALLKIDVEGSEIEIVEGADDATWKQIERVVVEYHDLFRPGCRDRVVQVLARQGFKSLKVLPEVNPPGLGLIRASRA